MRLLKVGWRTFVYSMSCCLSQRNQVRGKTNGNPPPIDDNREYPRPNAQEEIYNQVAKSKQTK